ncbi:MAG: serine hydrolase [Gammaproteobacteria bacterium]|nr:serine hydrolase [Gammaproteobacteria bacterium]
MIRLPTLRRLSFLLPLLLLSACGSGRSSNAGAPVIESFSASPARVNAGREVTLSWRVRDADRLLLLPGNIDVTGTAEISLPVTDNGAFALQASNERGSRTQPATVVLYDWRAIGDALDSAVRARTIDGASFALIDRDGPLYTAERGDISLNQMVPLASASKLPTVMAILTLVDTGQLALDRPVGDYLARDAGFDWPADKAAITLRMLLAHTAGIVGLGDTQPDCLLLERLSTLRDCAQAIAKTALVATPGSAFNYGGADMQVAAYIATLVSDEDWQDLFAGRIGSPLELGGLLSYGDPAVVSNPRVAGGAVASAPAYARLLRVLLNDGLYEGRRVLSTAMVAELLRDQTTGLPVLYQPFPADRATDYPGYGLGVFISAPRLHPGSSGPEYSDPGLFGATPWIDLGLGYGGVLLIESTTDVGLDLWDQLRPLVIRQLTGS